MTDKSDLRTITTLMGDALSQFSKLFQNEVDLAKAELGEKAQQVGVAAGFLAGAAVLVIPAIIMALARAGGGAGPGRLVGARRLPLAALVPRSSPAFLVIGMQRLKPENLKPTKPSISLSGTRRPSKDSYDEPGSQRLHVQPHASRTRQSARRGADRRRRAVAHVRQSRARQAWPPAWRPAPSASPRPACAA